MVNNISRASFNDERLYADPDQKPGLAPLSQAKESNAEEKVTEIFNHAMSSPSITADESPIKQTNFSSPNAKTTQISEPITAAMLDELATALQYGLPFLEIIRKAPSIINTQLSNGMLPLHFAIHYSEREIIELLLKFTDLQLKDANGLDAFDHAVQENNDELAKKIMSENISTDLAAVRKSSDSMEKVNEENPSLKKLLANVSEEDLLKTIKALKEQVKRGTDSHNTLIVAAIDSSDYKFFIRLLKMGADLRTIDPSTGENLLHLAIKAGQEEIICFLLKQFPHWLELRNSQGVTPLQIAEKNNSKKLVDLIHSIQNPESCSLEMKAKLDVLNNNLKDYMEAFQAKVKTLSDDEKRQLFYVAMHGATGHPEGSQGHNQFVLKSIINQNLEELVCYASLGFNPNSISVPLASALEDPMGWVAKTKARCKDGTDVLKELMGYVSSKLNLPEWGNPDDSTPPGKGKSLLDMAVYYAKDGDDEQKSLEIIAYLLKLGLDPMRMNDEGESPFSTALLKGNYKAALLMCPQFTIPPSTNKDNASFDRTYLLLKEGSKLRDPLAVNSSQVKQGFFAAAFLLTNVYAANSMLSYINYVPIFLSIFGINLSEPTYREKLNGNASKADYPELLKQVSPSITKASILEFAVLPQTPIATLASTVIGVYTSSVEAMLSAKNSIRHAGDRPFSATYKVVVNSLPLVSNSMRLLAFYRWIFPAALDTNPRCVEVNKDDYKNMTAVKRLEDKKLDAECVDHAKILLGKWNEDEANEKQYRYNVKALYKKEIMSLHTDKQGRNKDLFEKFSIAKTTVLAPKGLPEFNSIPYSGVILDTAAKAAIVWGASTSYFVRNFPGGQYAWPALTLGSLGFKLGQGIYRSFTG
ncbi:MAG TPA: ankyrin repeat domain-containing protein [Parachlamydiaceae bacterium]|nr:ankyrin repeat domain-containing protein [Parachlamydiaceae bacterium]